MEMVNDISAKILGFGAQLGGTLGMFFIPVVILSAIALLWFAKHSYKFLKVVLPIAGMGVGAYVGATYLAPLVETHLAVVGQYVNPVYLCAIVLAAVLGLLCLKYHTFAILVIGAACGYLFLGRIVKDLLLSIPFILQIANDVIRLKSYTVGVIICAFTMVIFTFIVKRYFKKVYVFVTSFGVATATLAIASVLLFQNTSIASYAAIAGTALGVIVGLSLCYKQLGEVYLDY